MDKQDIFKQVNELAGQACKVAAEMDLGDDRIQMFSVANVLRKLCMRGYAEEVEQRMNPLLDHSYYGSDEDDDWDEDDED